MEKDLYQKLNIGALLITAIIIAGILMWAKINLIATVPEKNQQTKQTESFDAEVVNTVYTGEMIITY